jgi:hypothetical protein
VSTIPEENTSMNAENTSTQSIKNVQKTDDSICQKQDSPPFDKTNSQLQSRYISTATLQQYDSVITADVDKSFGIECHSPLIKLSFTPE